MQDNKTAQMREYLKLKQIQENDESDEIIEEVYNNVITKEDAERDEMEEKQFERNFKSFIPSYVFE